MRIKHPHTTVKPSSNSTVSRPTFPLSHRIFRLVWGTSWLLLCAWTPPFLWRWRRWILQMFGAKIGNYCDVRGTASVWDPRQLEMHDHSMLADGVRCYNVARVTLYSHALVSQQAYLCSASHDIDSASFDLVARPITLYTRSWVASDAFVGPGVSLGEGAVLAARAATFRDLDPWKVYRGNPATVVRDRKRDVSSVGHVKLNIVSKNEIDE